jgi:hypothetical protein
MSRIRLANGSRKVIYIGALLVVLAAAASLGIFMSRMLSPAEPSSHYQPQSGVGISMGGLAGTPVRQINRKLADIASLGFTWIRLDISWSGLQPHNFKQYNWKLYDPVVAAANRYHLKVLGILGYAPGWAAQNGCTNRKACAPENPTQFAAFAGQAAAHYRKGVQDWEIWNEENINKFWSPTPSAGKYAQVLMQSYRAIKAANPTATVVLGGMAVGHNPNKEQVDAVTFLQELYQAGAKGSFDAVGYHPYTYPRTPFDTNTAWAKLPSLRSIMQAHGDGAKQIWITEYGAPTNGPAGSGFVSETVQAQLARDAFAASRNKAWIGPFFWYTYQDRSTDTSTKENFFGLRRADGSEKPSYAVWKQILAK